MTTTLVPVRRRQPVRLQLGAMRGIEFERQYGVDFWFQRALERVDQRPQIALLQPPLVYVTLPPSACMHTMRPYVVDACEEQETYVQRDLVYRWRYNWYTRCKRFALRIGVPDPVVILQGTRIEVYDELPTWYRLCGMCAAMEKRGQSHA
jgi:hypothetical protein